MVRMNALTPLNDGLCVLHFPATSMILIYSSAHVIRNIGFGFMTWHLFPPLYQRNNGRLVK